MSEIPQQRKSIRLPGYDYSQAGAYFVTVVSHQRKNIFGIVQDDMVRLNPIGSMVEKQWLRLPDRFPTLELDTYVVMPNHIHGVLVITGRGAGMNGFAEVVETHPRAPTGEMPLETIGHGKYEVESLATIIRSFKSAATLRWHAMHRGKDDPLWQRNYYEHIIRDEKDLARAREYILNNQLAWSEDGENPGISPV